LFLKARPVDENDPGSPWRHVDTIDGPLYSELFEGCNTLGKIWDEAAKLVFFDFFRGLVGWVFLAKI